MWNHPLVVFVTSTSLSIPLAQVVAYIVLVTLALFFHKYKFGLLISYVFVFFWGYVLHFEFFMVTLQGSHWWALPLFFLSGFFVFVLAVVKFFSE